MKFIIWKIIGEKDIMYGVNKGTKYVRIALKGLDDKNTYYLNLPNNLKNFGEWNKSIEEGNIIEANLQTNGKNINYFMNHQLIKDVRK